jgi:peptide/nickel transport system substrate-binding protein
MSVAATRMIRRRNALTLGAAAVAAGSRGHSALADGNARVLRFVPILNPSSLDSLWAQSVSTREAAFMVFDTLYGLDASLTPQPQMVEGHELSEDRLTWRFNLREGLRFHDGEPVRARDAVASIGRWAQRAPLGVSMKKQLDEMRAIDDRRFEIQLKKPFPHLLYGLGRAVDCVVRPERVAGRIDAFTDAKDYTGSGPYKFLPDEWVSGAYLAFRRNEHYVPRQEEPSLWAGGKVANFDRIEWTIMPDAVTASGAVTRGEVDWLDSAFLDLVPQLRQTSGVTVERLNPFGWWSVLQFNTRAPPFDNLALRRALFPAVNQADYMGAVVGDRADLMRTGVGLFNAESPLQSKAGIEVLTGPRDLDLARRLVRDSGYTGVPVVQMAATDSPRLSALNLVAQAMMTEIGLNVVFQAMDFGTLVSRVNKAGRAGSDNWNCFCAAWPGPAVLDPGSHLPLFGMVPDRDPKMMELRDAWLGTSDLASQKSIADQMQLQAFEDPPFVPLGEFFSLSAYRKGLSGFVHSDAALFWNVRRA